MFLPQVLARIFSYRGPPFLRGCLTTCCTTPSDTFSSFELMVFCFTASENFPAEEEDAPPEGDFDLALALALDEPPGTGVLERDFTLDMVLVLGGKVFAV